MKRTHLSTGTYDRSWQRSPTSRTREKHTTACGTVADCTKATTDRNRVTCLMCLKKNGGTR